MILMLGLAMQVATVAVTSTAVCSVVDVRPAEAPAGGAGLLVAGCGTHGAPLGAANHYSAVWSPVANGLLVVWIRGARTQVLIVSPAKGGTGVAVNDVTRELVGLTGKSPNLRLGSATIDSSRFAADGSVGVLVAGFARRLDLTPYTLHAAQAVVTATTTVPGTTN